MRGPVLLLLAAALIAADGPPSQAEQDDIWRKAIEESRQVGTRRLPMQDQPVVLQQPQARPAAMPTASPAAFTDPVPQQECGVGWYVFFGFLAIGVAVNLYRRKLETKPREPDASGAGGLYRGWWLTTPVRVDPVRTPLGSKVTVLLAQVNIDYDVSGDMVHVRRVSLSHDADFNVASERTGEAFAARYISEDALAGAVAADLANPDCQLRSTLLKAWHERHPDTPT